MDDLVKRLRELHPEAFGDAWDFAFACQQAMHEAADAIEELSKQLDDMNEANIALYGALPRWIPVSERLPECENGAEVGNIEWISHGMVHAGCFGRGGKYRDVYFRTWTDAGEGMDANDADYWRAVTLPEPPKELIGTDMGGGIRRDEAGSVIDWGITGPLGEVGKAEEE